MADAFAAFAAADKTSKDEEFKEDLNRILICPDCKEDPPNLVEEYSSGDMVCASCGLVLDRIIDTRSEWRTFSGDDNGNEDPSRVGDAPNLMIDGDQLQTSIAFDGKGAKNLAHLQNKITQDKGTKALLQAYRDIQALTDSINTGTQVANTAKHIFKMVDDNKALKGKSQEAIVAGCIFIACRQTGVPRTFREIYGLTKVSKKEIGRVFKLLEAFLQKMGGEDKVAKATGYSQQYQAKGSTTADELCIRFCSALSFRNPVRVESIARRLTERSSEVSDLAGRSPLSVAAACIYMAAHLVGEPRSYKAIAAVSNVSDGTVKTAYRYLYAAKDTVLTKEVFPEELFDDVLAKADKVPAA
ncbi:cyclin-like protein [Parathielavia hyrcaniae]|uniref:Transcription initiation factor IIB n=1 Tax=Parathielavia hyrcaniae TaxID=113614 RepID=A0AAN6Q4I5_9PEZI|nr:cyclin-like protein [Parathielavia hyrcaniae]